MITYFDPSETPTVCTTVAKITVCFAASVATTSAPSETPTVCTTVANRTVYFVATVANRTVCLAASNANRTVCFVASVATVGGNRRYAVVLTLQITL